jgi:hypothetical protein
MRRLGNSTGVIEDGSRGMATGVQSDKVTLRAIIRTWWTATCGHVAALAVPMGNYVSSREVRER